MTDKNSGKKPRTIYSPQQICYLEEKFAEKDFPNKSQRKKWADYLQLSEQHVQIWFQNKRAKQKRKQKIRANTEKQVHVPKPPSFWPQNLSFNSSLQVISSEAEVDLTSNRSCSESTNNSGTGSETTSPVSTNVKSRICLEEAADRNDDCRETSPVAASNHNDQNTTADVLESSSGTISEGGKFEHRMQFISNGFTNGLSSPASVNYHLQQTYPSNTIPLYTFKPEVIANPLLLLASCATQLHKVHKTLSANKKKSTT